MFSFLFTPVGRYAALAVLVFALIGFGIHKIKQDAVAELEAAALADALRRTQNAINAGSAVDVSPERLRDDDPNERK
ncbi:MAG: hypothetical protein AMS22_05565 [Thiotrichales bacterium SG8_50]|nr:MAG: hypothetical protein AMS22_05565 [Thiotrichales bacterium SG8_50]